MGYKLCTAEKPSVAKDIARVVGADKKENGYFIGNGYIVTWAVGHLVGLAEPEAYGFVKQEDMYSDDKAKEQAYAEFIVVVGASGNKVWTKKYRSEWNFMLKILKAKARKNKKENKIVIGAKG